ncbi:uncharacterized protein LOC129220421 isoform X2 [Uloborus diversus]|uniref:uncharacterized protein LOC129220421 isoform X2 n=1 Tax=Uloborus diversus TaxID=327109 RepID=UPI002409C177|nr:uncharacterized protein LOC129220421 isoform X2 [Uloborus diversus]
MNEISLDFQLDESENESGIIQGFRALLLKCEESNIGKEVLREEGGLDILVEYLLDIERPKIIQHASKLLAFVIDGNTCNQSYLTRKEVVHAIKLIFEKINFLPTLKCTVVLASMMLSQNKNNQLLCATLFLVSLGIFEEFFNSEYIDSVSSFLTVCIANNLQNQDAFAEFNGVLILKHSLEKHFQSLHLSENSCIYDVNKVTLENIKGIIRIICVTSLQHESNSKLFGKLGVVSLLMKILSVDSLDDHLLDKTLLALYHIIHAYSLNKIYLMQGGNYQILLKKKLTVVDHELKLALDCLIEICLTNDNTLLDDEIRNEEDESNSDKDFLCLFDKNKKTVVNPVSELRNNNRTFDFYENNKLDAELLSNSEHEKSDFSYLPIYEILKKCIIDLQNCKQLVDEFWWNQKCDRLHSEYYFSPQNKKVQSAMNVSRCSENIDDLNYANQLHIKDIICPKVPELLCEGSCIDKLHSESISKNKSKITSLQCDNFDCSTTQNREKQIRQFLSDKDSPEKEKESFINNYFSFKPIHSFFSEQCNTKNEKYFKKIKAVKLHDGNHGKCNIDLNNFMDFSSYESTRKGMTEQKSCSDCEISTTSECKLNNSVENFCTSTTKPSFMKQWDNLSDPCFLEAKSKQCLENVAENSRWAKNDSTLSKTGKKSIKKLKGLKGKKGSRDNFVEVLCLGDSTDQLTTSTEMMQVFPKTLLP